MPRTDTLHSLRFVRALALLGALPACTVHADEVPPPPPMGGSSGGGVVVQDGVAQANTVVVQGNSNEQNVEMRTVVTGQQQQTVVVQPSPVCPLGQSIGCAPGQSAVCVSTSAGPAWLCQPVVASVCIHGQLRPGPGGSCVCVGAGAEARWQCNHDGYRHNVGPLPPPELSA